MEELRQALGLHYPVQENFDYSIGTSSGKLRVRRFALTLTCNRRYCNHRAFWQELEPEGMPRILS